VTRGSTTARARFSEATLAALRAAKLLHIRAGTSPHRFIGIWVVVVENRVFVRSWSIKPRSWYRTFREEPHGAIRVDGKEIPVSARFPKGERLLDAISQAYLEKYHTKGWVKYAHDLGGPKSRSTTTELVPL
jgi:hypothetical protein